MEKTLNALDWLVEENQPSVRYLALTELQDRSEDDSEVQSAEQKISRYGWAADVLSRQNAGGWWLDEERLYNPKYLSTNWMLLILSDLGLTREDPRIERACELWIKRFSKKDGGFATDGMRRSELCLVGNTARALVKFGYVDHPKVQSAYEWLVREQRENGGWNCDVRNSRGILNGVIDAWEGMSAFAVYPRQRWTRSMKLAVERGAEFYLERELHKEGPEYAPWYRFHYPVHYFYDLLVGLDFMTALGYGDDRRLNFAFSLLKEKRRPDGRWNLDAIHPDLEGRYAKGYEIRPQKPFALEKVGESSKMVTLRAMQVLKRVEG